MNARRATATIGNLRFQRARVTRRRGPKARVLSLKGMYYLPPSEAVMPMRNNRQKIWEHMADGYGKFKVFILHLQVQPSILTCSMILVKLILEVQI